MNIIKTKFKGLKIIKRDIFHDSRGYFQEVYKQKQLKIVTTQAVSAAPQILENYKRAISGKKLLHLVDMKHGY